MVASTCGRKHKPPLLHYTRGPAEWLTPKPDTGMLTHLPLGDSSTRRLETLPAQDIDVSTNSPAWCPFRSASRRRQFNYVMLFVVEVWIFLVGFWSDGFASTFLGIISECSWALLMFLTSLGACQFSTTSVSAGKDWFLEFSGFSYVESCVVSKFHRRKYRCFGQVRDSSKFSTLSSTTIRVACVPCLLRTILQSIRSCSSLHKRMKF